MVLSGNLNEQRKAKRLRVVTRFSACIHAQLAAFSQQQCKLFINPHGFSFMATHCLYIVGILYVVFWITPANGKNLLI